MRRRWRAYQGRFNPTIRKCPGCGNGLRKDLSGRAFAATFAAWIIFGQILPPNVSHLSGLRGWAISIGLCIPFRIAAVRLYHAWWHWRHPERCDDGGHVVPEPGEAGG